MTKREALAEHEHREPTHDEYLELAKNADIVAAHEYCHLNEQEMKKAWVVEYGSQVYAKAFLDGLESARQAEQEPVAWWFQPPNKNVRPMFDTQQHGGKWQPLYAAPQPVTTPDVCGEVCARAKLCYGCNKDLEEANAKYAEQAEQEPFAWMHPSGGCLSAHYMKEFATGLEKETHTIPLYASPVRTKDLTDDEILPDGYGVVTTYDGLLEFARAVIAADRELNRA